MTMDNQQRARRDAMSHQEQMIDAQAECVPCKLCGGRAVISDAGIGAGYYIECSNGRQFRKSKGCMLDGRRLGGWAYNVSEWWNRLHAAALPDEQPAQGEVREKVARELGGRDMFTEAEWLKDGQEVARQLGYDVEDPRVADLAHRNYLSCAKERQEHLAKADAILRLLAPPAGPAVEELQQIIKALELQLLLVPMREREAYEAGKLDGYDGALQDVDMNTGGDGEYRFCTAADDSHCPDAEAMMRRIMDRFSSVTGAQNG